LRSAEERRAAIDVGAVSRIIRSVAEQEILPRFRALGAGDVREKSGPMDLVTVADIAA
jgi:fructose-1,6-bisphosphatase/inositol monophosphatase family enzyme